MYKRANEFGHIFIWQNINSGLTERYARRAGENPADGHSMYFLIPIDPQWWWWFLVQLFSKFNIHVIWFVYCSHWAWCHSQFNFYRWPCKKSEEGGYRKHLVSMDALWDFPEQIQHAFWCCVTFQRGKESLWWHPAFNRFQWSTFYHLRIQQNSPYRLCSQSSVYLAPYKVDVKFQLVSFAVSQ